MLSILIDRIEKEKKKHPKLENLFDKIYRECLHEVDNGDSLMNEVEKSLDRIDEIMRDYSKEKKSLKKQQKV